jgi:16S rRNA processing protein RimM
VDRIEVGYVARAHGLRGEVRVHLHAAESTVLYDVDEVWVAGRALRVESVRPGTGAVLIALEGVHDRDAAEALRGAKVEVDRAHVPLAEGEYLLADLPGYRVVDAAGSEVGVVAEVMRGAQPILVIHGGGHERLLPAVPEFVRSVDAATRVVVVELPEDLPAEPI